MQCYNDVFQFNVSSQRLADSIQGQSRVTIFRLPQQVKTQSK